MLFAWSETRTSQPLGVAQAAAQLTTVKTCPSVHTAGRVRSSTYFLVAGLPSY